MIILKKTFFAFCLSLPFISVKAATPADYIAKNSLIHIDLPLADSSIPRVFILGQYDGSPFERLKGDYQTSLIAACKNDMEAAYYCWMHLLKHMESHASVSKFDMNGIKLWLYVFWEKDGTISYIAYHPKPNSKNFKAEEMTAFLNSFAASYTFPVKSDKPYSNYSTASFPVLVENPTNNSPGNATTKSIKSNNGQRKK